MDKFGFSHLDPTKTKVYMHYTVVYGFELADRCFRCKVRKGYLVGKRTDLPEGFGWMIGQHIDVVNQYVTHMCPLSLCSSG